MTNEEILKKEVQWRIKSLIKRLNKNKDITQQDISTEGSNTSWENGYLQGAHDTTSTIVHMMNDTFRPLLEE